MGMRYSAAIVDQSSLDRLGSNPEIDQIETILDGGIDLDKMWNAAQIVLAGSLEVGEPLMTGHPIGEDLGYGPAFLASPDDVVRVAATLGDLSKEDLVAKVDVNELDAQVAYPNVWLSEPAESLAIEVGHAAWMLADLYQRAAKDGHAIVGAIR